MERNHNPNLSKGYNYIIRSIILMYGIFLSNSLTELFDISIPIVRYSFATLALFYYLRGISLTMHKSPRLGYLRMAYYFIFVCYILFIVISGIPDIFSGIKNDYYLKVALSGNILLYLLPVIIYSEPNLLFYKKLFKISLWLVLIYLILIFPLFSILKNEWGDQAEQFSVFLGSSGAILLLTFPYHAKRIRWTVIIVLIILLIISALDARRNQFIFIISVFFFTAFISLISSSQMVRNRRSAMIGSFFMLLVFSLLVYFLNSEDFNPFVKKMQTGFSSREIVIDDLENDFDNKPKDWAFGRGMNGEYYSKTNSFTLRGGRDTIENGYLFLILKGGYIYLSFVIILSLIAMYRGFFKSHNLLSKAFAAIVLIQLIDMIGFGLPMISFKYILVWIAISACLSKKARALPDNLVKQYVGLK